MGKVLGKPKKRRSKRKPKTPYLRRKVVSMTPAGPHMNRLVLSCGHVYCAADPIGGRLPQPVRYKCYRCKTEKRRAK